VVRSDLEWFGRGVAGTFVRGVTHQGLSLDWIGLTGSSFGRIANATDCGDGLVNSFCPNFGHGSWGRFLLQKPAISSASSISCCAVTE
jgi:hypothetical protein